MLMPFRLKRPIGPDSVMDRDDVLNTKRALNTLGFLEAPDYGLTPYPDAPMIAAVKGFQRRHGLSVDGVMNPDGPTAEALGQVLAAQQARNHTRNVREGEWDWMDGERRPRRRYPGTVFSPEQADRRPLPSIFDIVAEIGPGRRNDASDVLAARRALAWAGHLPRERATDDASIGGDLFDAVRAFQRESGLTVDGWMDPSGETARALDNAIAPKVRAHLREAAGDPDDADADRPGVRVAKVDKPPFPNNPIGTTTLDPLQGGGGAVAIGAAIAAQELLRQQRQRQGTSGVAPPAPGSVHPRTDMAPPLPPLPGSEPPKDKDQLPSKTELPVQTVELPDLSQPIPDVDEPTIFVHPVPPEDLANAGTIIERKGNEETRKELERVRDHFRKLGWDHTAGGRYAADDPVVLNSGGKIKPGDEREEFRVPGHFGSLKGGHFTDLTFELRGGQIVHVQTVDVDRNGNPSQRELDTAERIVRATGQSVLLIPKGAQLDRLRH